MISYLFTDDIIAAMQSGDYVIRQTQAAGGNLTCLAVNDKTQHKFKIAIRDFSIDLGESNEGLDFDLFNSKVVDAVIANASSTYGRTVFNLKRLVLQSADSDTRITIKEGDA